MQADDDLIDAYCGVGSFGLIAADKVKSVRGVDSERTAIEDARFNTKKNKVENANFYIGNADQVMNRLAKNNESTSVIIATAPKKGLLKGFIEASVKMQPREFIYLSFQTLWYVILSSLSKMVMKLRQSHRLMLHLKHQIWCAFAD